MKERTQPSKNHQFRLITLCCFAISSFVFYFLAKPNSRGVNGGNLIDSGYLPKRQDWLQEDKPAFCNALKQFPQPSNHNCKRLKDNVTCDATKPQFFSQDGEDYYLYTRHFANLNRPGVYVDVAANDAVHISNTYFMDRCLDWSGICAEANSKYYETLFRKRSCLLVPTCISDSDGATVRFGLRGASGGIVDTYKGDIDSLEKSPIASLTCATLERIFERVGLTHVDYLSLDVEGHELMVLKGIDWNAVRISVITVELSSKTGHAIVAFLESKGFYTIDSSAQEVNGMTGFHMNDPVFVHKSQVFGKPSRGK